MVASAEVCRMNGAKSRGPVSERGKMISARNATKHGLLAEKPPILATEDLATFQGLMQSLVDTYQPEGAVEWHLVQTIAMCIQRQNRLWVAEAALGNAQVLPAVSKPYTDEKYPALKLPQTDERWSSYHPANLNTEREVLTRFVEKNPLENIPTEIRSKYFADSWTDWVEVTQKQLKRLDDEYPTDGIPGKPRDLLGTIKLDLYTDLYLRWVWDLYAAHHPFAVCWLYAKCLDPNKPPTSKGCLQFYLEKHHTILEYCQKRIDQIEQIEQEMQQERDRYQQDLAAYQALTANPIPQQVALLSRYESHISTQLERSLNQLQMVQKERKKAGSMGSFGQN
ncbi:hypothetical protein [Neosynechococcus sphagnicola]|uniref:hypothetical protein n=1 Tax=Neosynechococcus sphagnicola TaxID=1501145 RepID=UPI000689EBE5|nr:hypothetical protein [Neosynechococcus sphagnicola]